MKFIFTFIALCAILSLGYSQKKKTIYLIRHGETDFNTDPVPRVRGRINVPLNDIGIAHCKAAGDFLSNVEIGKVYYVKFLEQDNQQNVLYNNIVLK